MYKIINKKKLAATVAADIVGNLLFALPRLFRKRETIDPGEVGRILVIRTAYIGDVVMTLPLLKPLRELYPQATISFLTSRGAAEALRNNPYIDEIIAYDPFWFYKSPAAEYGRFISKMRQRTFDMVIETRADIREIVALVRPLKARYRLSYGVGGGGYLLTHRVPYPGLKHKVQYHLDIARFLGYRGSDLEWGVYLTDTEKRRVNSILAKYGFRPPFIAMHPGSRLPLKRWPMARYGELADALADRLKLPVVMFGAPDEKAVVEEMIRGMQYSPISLAGILNLREMAGVLGRASVFVCNDSGPMHIAAAMKTPTVALFGPSKSVETGPYGEGHRVVEKDFPCRTTCDESSCSFERHNACMQDLTVDDAFRAVADIITRSKAIHVQT